ncbi:MAG: ATP-binding protein [Bryobacteraceae bacterium]
MSVGEILSALDRIGEAFVIVESGGRLRFVSSAAQQTLGMEPGTVIDWESPSRHGLYLSDMTTFCPARDFPLHRALSGEVVPPREFFVRNELHSQGLWIRMSAGPHGDRGGIALWREHTLERQAREQHARVAAELDASRQRLQAIFDHALDGILLADDDMQLLDANASACRLLKYEEAGLVGMSIPDISSSDYPIPDIWKAFLQAGEARGEIRLRRKDGTEVDAEFLAVANILPGIHLSLLRDISERKSVEGALREAQKSESVGLLAGTAAHDFNNLLVGMIGQATLILGLPGLPEQASARIREIVKAGQRAAQLARQMLSYLGQAPPVSEPLDLSEAVREIGALVETAIPKKVHVSYELRAVPPVNAVPAQIQQVIMNLIINAGQAIQDSSPGIIFVRTGIQEVSEESRTPETAALAAGKYVFLEVEDTGRGMDDHTRERVFEPFFTTKTGGRGLGLVATRGIIADHDGAIWVRSAPDRGSCFTVLLPVSTLPVKAAHHQLAENLSGRGRVLIVEAEPIVQRVATTALERLGYEVTAVADETDALPLLTVPGIPYDAVVLELGNKTVAARQFIEWIQRNRPSIRIVGSSVYPESEAAHGLGLAGYLEKPYTPHQLGRILKQVLPDYPV